jgi:hypothetical protein
MVVRPPAHPLAQPYPRAMCPPHPPPASSYDLILGESAILLPGWGDGVREAASAFDERHTRFAQHMQAMIATAQVAPTMAEATPHAQAEMEVLTLP